MRITYSGPVGRVVIDVPGRGRVSVNRGDTIEVPDALGASLTEQDIWERAPAPTTKPAADGAGVKTKET